MGHRKRHRVAERPRWVLTPAQSTWPNKVLMPKSIDFARVLDMDLIYDDRAVPAIKSAFPAVQIVDAFDFVHESRVSIEMAGANISKDQWYRFLVTEGLTGTSFTFELDRISAPTAMLAWLNSWKPPIMA